MEDVESAHPLVASHDVGGRVALGMARVQTIARRVGKHVEGVVLGAGRIDIGSESLVLLPIRLPLFFDAGRVVGHDTQTIA